MHSLMDCTTSFNSLITLCMYCKKLDISLLLWKKNKKFFATRQLSLHSSCNNSPRIWTTRNIMLYTTRLSYFFPTLSLYEANRGNFHCVHMFLSQFHRYLNFSTCPSTHETLLSNIYDFILHTTRATIWCHSIASL